ncbi:phage tail-collar fiber domain-containing protein [Xenorhabdus doucetiae]|uniref:phage tail-collar fiber domain-containing protein n=1 Tax=Xenorhabdus doucetiae TaxID=351671 RepID=UPI0006991E9A|nr:phage tail protein [Xenorhabdus doucetiae]
MSSVITLDFEKWKAQQVAAGNAVILDEFIFANVPGLDPSQDISRSEQLPAAQYIVHRQAVNKTGACQ